MNLQVGRLHCLVPTWEDSSVSFLKSGGFVMSSKVAQVKQRTLVLWGKNDEILEPSTAEKFRATLPDSKIVIVEKCGHCPHLEQPEVAAEEILNFIGDI